MRFIPQLSEAEEYARQGFDVAPVSTELFSDVATPIETLKAFREKDGGACFLFESVEGGEKWARYSFIGFQPVKELFVSDGVLSIRKAGREERVRTDNPNAAIRAALGEYKSPRIKGFPTFTGGFVGYFSYEYYKYAEKTDLPCGEMGDARLFLFDKVIAYDNVKHKIILIVNASLHGDIAQNYRLACEELQVIKATVLSGCKRREAGAKILRPFAVRFRKEEYEKKVEKAKRYIYEGDIFQCVPSNCWTAEAEGGLLNAYRVLRVTNPSPYMIYLNAGMGGSNGDIETEIAGASPETLVKVTDGRAFTFPIAGTRPRGKTPEEDRALEAELLRDEKELAEHNMLVDLGRNDLGKVCKFGSVHVEDYQKIYRFSHVMHITSSVSGVLREDKDGLDALSATLPAGTLSGAPKKRAVEIIKELEEGAPRGVYGGAVGYLDFMGNCDFCIAIRTAVRRGKTVTVRAGGGIVEGSMPENEYFETCNKSAAPREAVLRSEEVDE